MIATRPVHADTRPWTSGVSVEDPPVSPAAGGVPPRADDLPFSVQRINGAIVIRVRQASEAAVAAQPLTQREREVLSLVAEGCSNKDIGHRLTITERTVKSHLTYIMVKLRAADRSNHRFLCGFSAPRESGAALAPEHAPRAGGATSKPSLTSPLPAVAASPTFIRGFAAALSQFSVWARSRLA